MKRNKLFTMRMTEKFKDRLEDAASELNMTASQFISYIVNEYLKEQNEKN